MARSEVLDAEDRLTKTFAALANPTRRAILERLSTGDASVNELAEPFDMSLPAISKHLGVLERSGLIRRERQAQYRRCVIEIGPVEEIFNWTEKYRYMWEDRFDRMDAYVQKLKSEGENNE